MSSSVSLEPSEFRCDEHGNQDVITQRVTSKVQTEIRGFNIDRKSSEFRVVAVCPGNTGDLERDTSHLLTFTGKRIESQ